MKQFSRSLCSLIVALEIGFVTGLFDATAATPEVERPLGVLISPFSSEQTTRISSVTIKPPDAEDRVQRPLGVLIDTIGDPITPTPPLLPRHIRYGLTTAPKQQPQSNQPEKHLLNARWEFFYARKNTKAPPRVRSYRSHGPRHRCHRLLSTNHYLQQQTVR